MPTELFLKRKQMLMESIIQAIEEGFKEFSIPFDRQALLQESKIQIEDLAAEAFFYGAEAFPQ
ncbi:hypothetical protein [Rhizobium phage RHph_X66]|nr:hypothetical protein [Rhizobium phage RHph_X66]